MCHAMSVVVPISDHQKKLLIIRDTHPGVLVESYGKWSAAPLWPSRSSAVPCGIGSTAVPLMVQGLSEAELNRRDIPVRGGGASTSRMPAAASTDHER